jgi:predicted unusual protein kinase regulating ubiquinone biosynthesis (AarF/ABC1/UbiB family)
MLDSVQQVIFIIKSLWHIFIVYLSYLWGATRYACVENLTTRLSGVNIFYVKIFQMLSTNAFIFTDSEIALLARFTEDVPYDTVDINNSFRETLASIATQSPEMAIELVNHSLPIKSGTMSLVYEGRMRDRRVVIKVRRNGADAAMREAFANFDTLLRVLTWLSSVRNLNLHEILAENRDSLLGQTDFSREASDAQRMQHNFRNLDYVVVPTVYPRFTDANPAMIVMDYIDGSTIEDIAPGDRDEYAVLFARFVSKCLFFDRFFHADLHPGNIRFMLDEGVKRLGIIDFGIMGEMTREEQNAAYCAHRLIAQEKWSELADLVVEFYVEPKVTINRMKPEQLAALKRDIAATLSQPEWSNMGPDGLFAFSRCLHPYNLAINKAFSKMELAVCVSASIHLSLGNKTDFKTAMEEASCKNPLWEI